jgi:hypothetical protein
MAGLTWVLERARQERQLLAPASPRLAPPHQCVECVELAFVVARFAFDPHRFERAFEATRVV